MHLEPDLYINEVTQNVLPMATSIQQRYSVARDLVSECEQEGAEGPTEQKQMMSVDCLRMGCSQAKDATCVQAQDQAFENQNVESSVQRRMAADEWPISDVCDVDQSALEDRRSRSLCGGEASDDDLGLTISSCGDCDSIEIAGGWVGDGIVAESRETMNRVSFWLQGTQEWTKENYIEGVGTSTVDSNRCIQPPSALAAPEGCNVMDRSFTAFHPPSMPPEIPLPPTLNDDPYACSTQQWKGCSQPLLVPIIIHMDEDDHKILATQWFSRSLPDPSVGVDVDFQQSFARLRLLQEHLCECQPPSVALLRVGIAKLPEALDTLHDHFLHCIEASMV